MGLAFIYPAQPTCIVVYVQKSDFHWINVFFVVIAVKNAGYYFQPRLSSLVLYCIAAIQLWGLRPKLHICVACC